MATLPLPHDAAPAEAGSAGPPRAGWRPGRRTLALGVLLLALLGLAFALLGPRPLPSHDASFAVFWKDFSTAVTRDDDVRVKAQTLAPLMNGRLRYDKHDIESVTDALFGPAMRYCVAESQPEQLEDGRYMLVCDPFVLLFDHVEGRGWRFSEFGLYE
jgi:hypothetical protein